METIQNEQPKPETPRKPINYGPNRKERRKSAAMARAYDKSDAPRGQAKRHRVHMNDGYKGRDHANGRLRLAGIVFRAFDKLAASGNAIVLPPSAVLG